MDTFTIWKKVRILQCGFKLNFKKQPDCSKRVGNTLQGWKPAEELSTPMVLSLDRVSMELEINTKGTLRRNHGVPEQLETAGLRSWHSHSSWPFHGNAKRSHRVVFRETYFSGRLDDKAFKWKEICYTATEYFRAKMWKSEFLMHPDALRAGTFLGRENLNILKALLRDTNLVCVTWIHSACRDEYAPCIPKTHNINTFTRCEFFSPEPARLTISNLNRKCTGLRGQYTLSHLWVYSSPYSISTTWRPDYKQYLLEGI